MSADNGIYILPSPCGNGFEYRVVHAQAIENIEGDPLYEILLFADSPVFKTSGEAFDYAFTLEKDYHYLEYGVCMLDERKVPFSNLTKEEAQKALFNSKEYI